MKLKKVSCTQFAGIRDMDISFGEGINVVYGKNESGKSTLVNLLSRTLFQKARLDGRSDKEFFNLYFPSVSKGGIELKSVDGKISFETENGTYILTKEWGEDARSVLSTPEGVIRDQNRIDEILHEILSYGEGVYSDMLFSSQNNTDLSLQTILDASKKTDAKQEITAALTMAFAGSGGLSVDTIGQAISTRIEQIAGKHWDFERNTPDKKSGGGRWSNGLGEIHKAYYKLEDAKEVLNKISELEKSADRTAADYEAKNTEAEEEDKEYRRFNSFVSRLIVQNERKDKLERLKNDISKYSEILAHWPIYAGQLQKARDLQIEKQNRELLDKYSSVKQIADELHGLKTLQSRLLRPEQKEINDVKYAQKKIIGLENKLCCMNLAATVKMLGGDSVQITSLRNGEIIDVTGGNISITEAVKITVPNVMEMQLSPADVDVSLVKAQIKEQEQIIFAVFARYAVDSIEALEAISRQFADNERQIDTTESRISMLLGDTSFKELKKFAETISFNTRSKQDIEDEISTLCEGADVSKFIAKKEAIIDGYIREYGDINSLSDKLHQAKDEYTVTGKSIVSNDDIPDEYLNIRDPESHRKLLQINLDLKRKDREQALEEKTKANAALESYKENLDGDPVSNAESAERVFNEHKSLLKHWLHISEVFKKQKQNLSCNPMHDICESFTKYLGIITDGKVSSEFPEQDKLDINIYSNKRPVDYLKLSEGTKETVSLAFRLAVLDHLFPQGGGVIVFDDPFTDMDDKRTAQACKLLTECANRHQVIFLTCKEEYIAKLDGKAITIG